MHGTPPERGGDMSTAMGAQRCLHALSPIVGGESPFCARHASQGAIGLPPVADPRRVADVDGPSSSDDRCSVEQKASPGMVCDPCQQGLLVRACSSRPEVRNQCNECAQRATGSVIRHAQGPQRLPPGTYPVACLHHERRHMDCRGVAAYSAMARRGSPESRIHPRLRQHPRHGPHSMIASDLSECRRMRHFVARALIAVGFSQLLTL